MNYSSLNILAFIASLLLFISCGQSPSEKTSDEANEQTFGQEYLHLSQGQLQQLGIFIHDTAIMYNNNMDDVGSLNLVIRSTEYAGNASTLPPTELGFYPRYITTLDTVQRTMYMISGVQARSEEEAQKWQSFESLVPIVVEQKQNDYQFGETLVFWMTKTPELERVLQEFHID